MGWTAHAQEPADERGRAPVPRLASPALFSAALELLTPERLAETPRSPGFRAAARRIAEGALELDARTDLATLWMMKDVGRAALYSVALFQEAALGQVSTADLLRIAAEGGICSPGRVIAFVEHAVAAGQIELRPGEAHWTRRPLGLRPAFWRYGAERFRIGLSALAEGFGEAEPEPPPWLALEATRAGFVVMAQMLAVLPHLSTGRSLPMGAVLDHEAGVNVLYDWLLQQPPGQAALIERAEVNKSALSRRHGVSRPHLSNLVGALEARGLVSQPQDGVLLFSEVMSTDFERHFAQGLQLTRVGRLAMLDALQRHGGAPTNDDDPLRDASADREGVQLFARFGGAEAAL